MDEKATPERIKKLFTNTDYPKEGIFELNLFLKGIPTKVVIDDKLPVHPKYNYKTFLARQSKKGGAWWATILEKAIAKLNVNYLNLHSGYSD